MISDRSLGNAAREIGLPPNGSDSAESAADPWSEPPHLAQLRQHVTLTESKGQEEGQAIVDVQFTDTRQEAALELVDQLTRQYVNDVAAAGKREKQVIQSERRRAKAQLDASLRGLLDVKSSLNQYVDDRLGQLAREQEDAARQPLDERQTVDDLEANVEADGKPTVADPASVPSSGRTEDEAIESDETDFAKTEPAARKTRLELLIEIRSSPEYHERYQEFATLRRRYEQDLSDAKQAGLPMRLSSARILETAQVIRHRGAAASGTRIVVLGLTAGFLAWRFASLAHRLKFPLTFTSVKDVADSLQVEVFGTITGSDGHGRAKRTQRRLWLVRFGTRAGEVTLATVLILLMFMSIVDRPFIGHLAVDPFSAYSYAVHWVTAWLIS